jgi:hypothetical protein
MSIRPIADELPVVRRIVTGIDTEGRSFFVEDGPPPKVLSVPERPGYRNMNLWRLLAQSRIDDPDTIIQHQGILPPPGGLVMRVIDVPPLPKDPAEAHRQAAAMFARMFPDAKYETGSHRSSGMHLTDTIDFAIVLAGEIVAIMDKGETLMRQGDILIQRGTNHAWENRTDQVARMLFILCDSER